MKLGSAVASIVELAASVLLWTNQSKERPGLPGRFVPFDSLEQCPKLKPRPHPPTSARDVRPDDFRVVVALGDSITAGLVARKEPDEPHMRQSELVTPLGQWQEYRSLSYPIGMDDDALTIAKIIAHYSPNITGGSTSYHQPVSCPSTLCHPESDGLNAAVSGSVSASLVSQVSDFLIPKIQELGLTDEWKYVNLGIGANDICAFCLSPNATLPLAQTPKQFAANIKTAVDLLREHSPNMIVNIIGLFRVSAIYKLTLNDPYCSGPFRPIVPRLPLECSCAMLPGPAGDFTRAKMDELGEAYDAAVLDVIKEWVAEDDPSFAAIWQPGTVIDLRNWPIQALSAVDCFHPSEAAHRRVAAGFWNRLTLSKREKAVRVVWDEGIMVRCLEDRDRIR